jgi:amino acid adenylation domain-containing protein
MGTVTNSAFHLSIEQGRLWQEQSADSSAFLAQCETALRGPLDRTRLKQAIRRVVESNEILRTAFRIMPGMKTPFQVIEDAPIFEWLEAPASDIEMLRTTLRRPFDLETGSCLRAGLVETGADEHLLLIAAPALCADAVSLTNLIAAIGAAYEGQPAGESLQYPDVVEWQREMLAAEESKSGREFWRRYVQENDFSGSVRAFEAFSRLRESASPAPEEFSVAIDANLYSRLRDAAAAIEITLPDFLLASWAALFARLTGSQQVAIHRNFDGRSFSELSGALGLLAKDIPLSFDVPSNSAFRAFAGEVKAAVSEATTWQDSFPAAESSAIPLGFEHTRLAAPAEFGELLFVPLAQRASNRRIALSLASIESASGLALNFRFNGTRLDRADVERWARHFLQLVETAATDPSTPISRLTLLSDRDTKTLLEEWNRTDAEYPRDLCLQELFERQAEQTPDRAAVRDAARSLTYRELNDRANRLAHYLGRQGVTPAACVGLLADRSVDLMVAIIAIMKSGAAYVPLSAEDPKARLAQRLNTVSVVVTERKFEKLLPTSVKTVLLDSEDEWGSESAANSSRLATPEDLAYVIYTSGSTGIPKGVGIRHRNLVNYSWYMRTRLELERHPEGLNFASVTTISADLGNTCIYASLISGGCLHLIPHDVASETGRMAEYCRIHQIDVLKIVPSHLSALIGTNEGRDCLPRRYLISGGEALTWDLVERIESLGGTCELINHYGPTETTVGSLTLRLADYEEPRQSGARVPIGRPIANTQLYILDSSGAPVPVGVTGELYIGGDGVAAGYVNEPAMTAERFVENPWKPGTRMYRTGDLCRYRPDGTVEILGRSDGQVKIRGYRIEIGEVEAAIRDYPGINAAVVIARPDDRGEHRLIAYSTLRDAGRLDPEALKAHLKEHLPLWMVPAAIVSLPKLPLTANGKIDRQALPDPAATNSGNRELTAPRNATEEALLDIWREVFRRDEIGVEDNFFDIGGHSLMATQVVSRLNKRFQVSPPASIIFEYPTIAGLAAWISDSTASSQSAEPLGRVPRDGALPLSFAQQRLWVIDQFDTGNPMYNVVRTLRIGGSLDQAILDRALKEIVRRHESQRTIFRSLNGEPIQVILPELHVPIEHEDFRALAIGLAETRARECVSEETSRRFDLANGPLLRAKCVRLAEDDHVLILSMHHIVSDGWSAAVFFNELSAIYSAFAAGQPSPLPELAIQYADYAAWQRRILSGANLTRQLDYWRKQLSAAPPSIALPYDRPHTENGSHAGTYELVELPRELTAPLLELSRQVDATLFMTLLAGYQAMLGFYSRQEKIVIGTDVANRPNSETEALIGFFVNLLPICTDLSGDPKFSELLARVRETAVGAYAHQDLPFDKLVEELRPERRFGHNPIVQSLFVMQNIPVPKSGFTGLSVRPFETPVEWSKFDLALFMIERENGLAGCWVYRRDLFDRSTILEMAACYEILLRTVVESPDTRLGKLGILMQEERSKRRERTPKKQFQREKPAKAAPLGEVN